MKKLLWGLSFLLSGLFILASMQHWVGFGLTEVLGFVTGGYCVWLVVLENIWNWPIGILNALAFTVLFLSSRLYADAGLQVIYIVLGCYGWYWWLKGGEHKSKLKVQRIGALESMVLLALGTVATIGISRYLTSIGDIAPFWDGLTTVSSLVAQYILTRKYLENWYVWIATDVVYIGLYGFKHLVLTAVLYAVFLSMCLVGVRDWRKSASKEAAPQPVLKEREA